jgi:uncharacterized repeat protein (TIGR01451 family)
LIFSVPGQPEIDYDAFLAWAQGQGYGSLSAAMSTSLIDPTSFDTQLDAGLSLAQAMAIFRNYAAGKVNGFADNSAAAQASTFNGSTTPDVNGTTPQAGNDAHSLDAGTTLVVDAAHGVLANDSDPDQQALTAVLVSEPAYGQLTFNSDGSFSYTPDANVSGEAYTDKFTYMATDGHGGTAIATVILHTLLTPMPDLSVGIAHAGNFVQGDVGDTYTLIVSNINEFATTGTVSLTDTLPAGLTATALSGDGWKVDPATLTATRSDPLAPLASYPPLTLTVNVANDAPASVTNAATVSGGGEQNTGNDLALDPTSIWQVLVWDGAGNNNNWSNPANWKGGAAPTAGDRLVFAGNVRQSTVNDLPAGTSFDEITFAGSGFTLSGNRVTLNPHDGTAVNDVASQDTIALPITLATNCTFEVTGSGALNLATTATIDTGSYTLTVDCAADSIGSQWAGAVVGSGGLAKAGAGVLTLTGANTYLGATAIENGTLAVAGGANRLPAGTTVTLGSGGSSGVLQLGDGTTSCNQSLAGLFVDGNGSNNRVVGGGTAIATLTLTVDSSDNVDEYDGMLGGSAAKQNNLALAMDGPGMVLMTGDNTFAGNTYINNGVVGDLQSDAAFGSGPIYLAGGTLGGYDVTLANDIVAVHSTTSSIIPLGTLALNGNISGFGAINCTNVTYDGISGGVLELGGDNSNFKGTFYQWADSDNGTISTHFTSASAGSDSATWQIDGGVLANEVSGAPIIALGALTGNGGTLSNAAAGSTVTYRIGDGNQSTEFDGVVNDGSGIVALTKAGAGRLTLAGANTYAGVTTIESGTLAIANAAAITSLLTNSGGVNDTGGFLILDYSGVADPASTVRSLLMVAHNLGGNRFHGQLRDTLATSSIGLGWQDDASTEQVTVMPALYGDANLDGVVTGQDLVTLLANYNGSATHSWNQGDINYDGKVTAADLGTLLANFNRVGPLNINDAP